MYLAHFGLREPPFALTPDTRFLYERSGMQEALNVLLVAIRSGEGFVKITGEVGLGKTMLCRRLLRSLDGEYTTAYVPNPSLTPAGLRFALAEELGLAPAADWSSHTLLKKINEELLACAGIGRRVVLLLDEAQALPPATLEGLRLLSNLESEREKLIQIVLFGQPELDVMLGRPELRQLRQRIAFAHRLQPLERSAAQGYLRHRLRIAGARRDDILSPRALRDLHRASGGVPRLLNILGHKALMAAYGQGVTAVERRHVRAALADGDVPRPVGHGWRTAWRPGLWALTSAAAGLGLYLWSFR
jgi:MSHA biogenesis protein MshM